MKKRCKLLKSYNLSKDVCLRSSGSSTSFSSGRQAFLFWPWTSAGCLLKPVINFSCKSKEGLITKSGTPEEKSSTTEFKNLSCVTVCSQSKLKMRGLWTLKNSHICVLEVQYLCYKSSGHSHTHNPKIPMYISVESPLCFSRQSVGFVVRIQWKDSEEGSGWESCCWQDQSKKLTMFLFNLFFVFLIWKHPCLVSCLNCFPLSGFRVMETMKRIPGSERGGFLALVFRAAVCSDLTVNWRNNSAAGSPAPPLHRIIIPVQIMML